MGKLPDALLVSAVALALAGCGGSSTETEADRAAAPDPSAGVEAALKEHFDSADYNGSVAADVLDTAIDGARYDVYTDKEYKLLLQDNDHLTHKVSCIKDAGHAYVCDHAIRGRIYEKDTTVEAVFDSAARDVVIRSEIDPDGQPFP